MTTPIDLIKQKVIEANPEIERDEEIEIWKSVVDYEGVYDVSNLGRVRSYFWNKWGFRTKPKLRKLTTGTQGYKYVSLYNKDRKKLCKAAVLVAKAFIPNPKFLECVNHKDGNKLNDNVKNLEWISRGDNVKHAFRIGLVKIIKGVDRWNSKLTEKEVKKVRALYALSVSSREIGKRYGISHTVVLKIVKYKLWSHV